MRYEVKFRVPESESGYATYIAKSYKSTTAPYQYKRPNNYRAQQFTFYDLDTILKFLNDITKKLGDKFILESIIEEDPELLKKVGGYP